MELKWVKKRSDYQVMAIIVVPGQRIYNRLQGCWYETTAERIVLVTGSVGEQWITSKAQFADTYQSGERVSETLALYHPYEKEDIFFAYCAQKNGFVSNDWNDRMKYSTGDWIVSSDPEMIRDCRVINKQVFFATYRIVNNV